MTSTPTILKALSLLAYVAMVGGLVALIFMRSVFSRSVPVIAFQSAAFLLLVWARITFGRRSFHVAANPTAGGLVTSGPYRYIRHPIYTSMLLFITAGVLAHLSWQSVLVFGLVFTGAIARIYCEETLLPLRYPEYKQYSSTTARIIPYLF